MSVYSPSEEEELDAPEIMLRMTLGWKWRGVDLEAACDPSSSANITYLHEDPTIKEVLLRYRNLNKQLSFVLPIGAFALFRNLRHIGGGRLFCLVGDKGYPTVDEFVGVRDPHIAIHGSISFMLNLHAIRTFFECMGGFSHATPYRDTFQVTGNSCFDRSTITANGCSRSWVAAPTSAFCGGLLMRSDCAQACGSAALSLKWGGALQLSSKTSKISHPMRSSAGKEPHRKPLLPEEGGRTR